MIKISHLAIDSTEFL